MIGDLTRYLEDIEKRIDADEEERLLEAWGGWIDGRNAEGPFSVPPRKPHPSGLDWPHVNINDALFDEEKGVYRELEGLNSLLAGGQSWLMRVRANRGVGNVAMAFGCRPFVMPYEMDTLPNVSALDEDTVCALIDKGLPDLNAGQFPLVWRFAEIWREIQRDYPRIGKYVRAEQPDLQGPLDSLELIMGSSPLFLAMYDEPDLVKGLLELVTKAFERYMDRWLEYFPQNGAWANYFFQVEGGQITIRDDSAMNLSPDMYDEFAAPYDGYLLKKYGGIVHFCGRGDHYIDRLAALEGLRGVNMSQPELNDMDAIMAATIDRGIHLGVTAKPFDPGGHDKKNLVFLPY